MGQMRLEVYDRERIPPGGLGLVYMCGADELPWRGRAFFSGSQLVVERNESDSGNVYVPWHIDGHGDLLVATATLMERTEPYQLEVELARGTVNRLRNQLAQWEALGLAVSDALHQQVLNSARYFSRAATASDSALAADLAQRSLAVAMEAMYELVGVYAQQAMETRRSQSRRITSWLGVHLGSQMPKMTVARQVVTACNMVSVPLTWRVIEATEGRRNWDATDAQFDWARTAGLKVSAGPMLELDDSGVPDWTYLWEGDFDSLLSFMLDHVSAVVRRYRSRVHLWQVAARICHGRVLALSEEQRLQIVAQAITKVRELDVTTPLVVTFDQPWAEYLATEPLDLAPLHFADMLVRADLGLSGIGIEINVGYHPGATAHRTPLAYSRLLDNWSLLDLPMMVSITVPSSAEKDPQSNPKVQVLSSAASEVSLTTQREWIERHMPMILAKSTVQVVVWNQLSDSALHQFPHGGLFDADDQSKPALEALRYLRQTYLP